VAPGEQLISVERKGTRAIQQVPASSDAFVWLRLYQQDLHGLVMVGRDQPVWWTLRRPLRPLTYHAAHRMFERVNDLIGANWTIHDLRHTAAQRMANDPQMALTDVQWVLNHAHLSTTERYTAPTKEQVIERALAHHSRRREKPAPVPAPGYNADSLQVLLGRSL
jgi:site-specific recombinase XerD